MARAPAVLQALVVLRLAALGGPLAAQTPPNDLAASVGRLTDEYVAAYFERHPEDATVQGIAGHRHDRLSDNSAAALLAWQRREDAWLRALRAIDPAPLAGKPAWTGYGIMRHELEGAVATRVCRYELWNLNHSGGWQSDLAELGGIQPVGSEPARAETLARWRAIGTFVGTEITNLREGARLGYTAPKAAVRRVIKQVDALVAEPIERSLFMAPARRDSTPAFRDSLAGIVATAALPALRRYRNFLEREYLPRARDPIGVSANPNGRACYRASITAATGLHLTPREIHARGKAVVAELEAAMRAIAERSFRTRDIATLLAALRADPRFTFRSREEMLDHTRAAIARAKIAMPRWFGTVPRADLVVQSYPAYRERESVGEWSPPADDGSRPGVYLLSTYDPTHKSRADAEPLAFHEGIPGHHLQGAIALERGEAIPSIARYFWSPGFGEGWAEYSELLADEMGLYSSDTTRLGALADVTLSATLLVVDTGIHELGWSRRRGIEYIRAHTRVPSLRAEVPVDRYPVWPAQGLSYGLGRLEIEALRREAQQVLGSRFDIRVFHDRVLEDGVIPLPLLREKITRWIQATR